MIFKNLKQSNKLVLSRVSSLHNDLEPKWRTKWRKLHWQWPLKNSCYANGYYKWGSELKFRARVRRKVKFKVGLKSIWHRYPYFLFPTQSQWNFIWSSWVMWYDGTYNIVHIPKSDGAERWCKNEINFALWTFQNVSDTFYIL